MSNDEQTILRDPQPLGPRGWLIGVGTFVLIAVVAGALASDLIAGALIAVYVTAVRVLVFTGPHTRGLVVTETATIVRSVVLPHADVVEVSTAIRGADRAAVDPDLDLGHAGLPESVTVRSRSPEGLERVVRLGSTDARRLAEAIEARRDTSQRPPLHGDQVAAPFHARQGFHPVRVAVILTCTALFDLVSTWSFPAVTTLIALGIVRTALRRVAVDDQGVRVGSARIPAADVVSARVALPGETSGVLVGRTRAPVWGPRTNLVVVRLPGPGEDERSVAARTDVLGVPGPIDLGRVDPTHTARHNDTTGR